MKIILKFYFIANLVAIIPIKVENHIVDNLKNKAKLLERDESIPLTDKSSTKLTSVIPTPPGSKVIAPKIFSG